MEAARLMLVDRLGSAAAARGEQLLAEIPGAVRRLGVLMLVLAFSVPVFLAACVGVLAWWLLA
jgi:hypothetical protein